LELGVWRCSKVQGLIKRERVAIVQNVQAVQIVFGLFGESRGIEHFVYLLECRVVIARPRSQRVDVRRAKEKTKALSVQQWVDLRYFQ